jgi:hypothetical protein
VATPEGLTLARHRDLGGRRSELWGRRASVALLAIPPLLAALNVFGQQPTTTNAAAPRRS